MFTDSIVKEVREARDKLAAKHGYDVHAMFEAARATEKTCGHKVVNLSKKRRTG